MSDLTVRSRTVDLSVVVELSGPMDLNTAGRVREFVGRLDLPPGHQLVLDLTGVTLCDSTGISALVAARNLAMTSQAGIALAGVPDRMARTLRMVGLGQVFAAHPTVDDAVAAWAAASA